MNPSPTRPTRPSPLPTALALALALATGIGPQGAARADGPVGRCGELTAAWAASCAQASGLRLRPTLCLPSRLVVEVDLAAEGALAIDITGDGPAAVAHGGGAGLSPVGTFADWKAESAGRRDALAAVARCADRDPSLLARAAQDGSAVAPPTGGSASAAAPPAAGAEARAGGRGALAVAAWVVGGLVGLLALGLLARSASVRRGLAAVSARWRGGPLSATAVLLVAGLVEAWALGARDADFYLPDPFHALVLGVLALYLVASFCPWPQARRGLLTLCLAAPLLVLGTEVRLAARDRDIAALRIAPSNDRLLRYTYRPGATVRDAGGTMRITDDGLWDQGHAIPRPPGVTRVVLLGDSVPNDPSLPFDRRLPHQLEVQLARSLPAGGKVEVINVSCEGYNSIQEERLLEKVGLLYQPDVVVLAYVLNDPFLQNGAYRRFGNSYFAFSLATTLGRLTGRSACAMFAPLAAGYGFDLVVRQSFERLRLVAESHHLPVVVAVLPIVERFDDPQCLSLYDQVVDVARAQGFLTTRVVDAFSGLSADAFRKPDAPGDVTHPNADGHLRMARRIAEPVARVLWPQAVVAPLPGAPPPPSPARVENRTGLELVPLPGGRFHLGCEPTDTHCFDDERPGREATVAAFSLARTDATVEMYARCVKAGQCTPPATGGSCNWGVAGRDLHPINCIDWHQATAFCRFAGLRLPTAAEWEYAAKGGEGREYPWGPGPVTGERANFCERRCFQLHIDWTWTDRTIDDGWESTSPVGSYPAGASRHGLLDMAGNAATWTADDYEPGRKEARGGGWDLYPRYLRTSARIKLAPERWFDNVTVRCAE